jgi:hypothetical protein
MLYPSPGLLYDCHPGYELLCIIVIDDADDIALELLDDVPPLPHAARSVTNASERRSVLRTGSEYTDIVGLG